MTTDRDSPEPFRRYLRVLGMAQHAPSLRALRDLVGAHVQRVPFENISKLFHHARSGVESLPGFDRFLDGIERYRFGGTCYANNYYLHRLLAHLGYDVSLCGADMSEPDVHVVNIVRIENHEYLVDAGYAAPFLEPLPRDLDRDHVVSLGRDRYVLRPRDRLGRSRLELYRSGNLTHGYVVKPTPRPIEHFSPAIARSFSERATFMNSLLLVRFSPGRSLVIHNLSLIESSGRQSSERRIRGRNHLPALIEDHFGIPRAVTAVAMARIRTFVDAWP